MQEVIIENIVKISTNAIYAGTHWTKRKKLKDSYLWLTKGPFKLLKPAEGKVDIDFTFFWAGRALDSSNVSFLVKMLEDCLVEYGIIKDDTIKHVGRVSMESKKSKSGSRGDYCVINIFNSDEIS